MFGLDNEASLIAKALQGSQSAWETLLRRHEKRVYNMAYRLCGQRQDALNLMQEAFLAVYRNLPNFRHEGSFEGWILRIVSHRSIDFLRRRNSNPLHRAQDIDTEQQDWSNNDSSSAATESQRLQLQLLSAMQRLSPEQRMVVELKFFQDLSFVEIAAQIGIPENTAKTRLYTALAKLREREELHHAL